MPPRILISGELHLSGHRSNCSRVDIALELGKDGLWDRLGGLWPSISSSFHPTTGSAIASEDSRVSLALALAKLERNLVAGLEEHQAQAR